MSTRRQFVTASLSTLLLPLGLTESISAQKPQELGAHSIATTMKELESIWGTDYTSRRGGAKWTLQDDLLVNAFFTLESAPYSCIFGIEAPEGKVLVTGLKDILDLVGPFDYEILEEGGSTGSDKWTGLLCRSEFVAKRYTENKYDPHRCDAWPSGVFRIRGYYEDITEGFTEIKFQEGGTSVNGDWTYYGSLGPC